MFSGIIETDSKIVNLTRQNDVLRVEIERPKNFNDIERGHSIAVNGVCLTVEEFDSSKMAFALGPETLKITQWNEQQQSLQIGTVVNLERPLKLGDRIHGHLVSGHVDEMGVVLSVRDESNTRYLVIGLSAAAQPYIWKKGSICINGVSLTLNEVRYAEPPAVNKPVEIEVCLIPETLKRTNLKNLKVSDFVTIEYDYLAKSMVNKQEAHSEFHS